jgi:hypothetical protein
MKRLASTIWNNIGFVCVALVLVYCVIHAFDPPRLNWGDSGSDYNVMTAGRNFQKYGFLAMRLTPHLLDPAYMTASDPSKIYTHYPQLPDLMNGVLRVVFRMSTLVQFRFVALAFSFSALYFVYALLVAYWERATAQFALALWVVNPMWIQHADYLHHAPYGAFFGFGSIFFLSRYLRGGGQRRYLAASGAFLYLAFFASYDFWFFAPLLAMLVTLEHYRALRAPAIRVLATLAACALAAILCKFATNAWVLGGIGPFLNDLRFQALERSENPSMRIAIAPGIWPTLYGRVERCFSLLLFPVAAFWAAMPFLRARWGDRYPALRARINNPWLLFFAAVPFLCLFVELWVSQYYPTLLVLPFYAVACGALTALLFAAGGLWGRRVAVVLMFALVANSVTEVAQFKKAYFPDSAIRTLRAQLDAVSTPGQYILTNHVFDFFYAYYFDRPTVDLILNPPEQIEPAIAYYSDPKRPRVAPATGAIFVEDKHLADEMFDKGFYYMLAHDGFWSAWGNPERYHAAIDTFITQRDSMLTAAVAKSGQKVFETDLYVVWRLFPPKTLSTAPTAPTAPKSPGSPTAIAPSAGTAAPSRRN